MAVVVAGPSLAPRHELVFFSDSLVVVELSLLMVRFPLAAVHELAHVLAGRRLGLRTRLRVSRRLYFVVFETVMNGLVAVPRRPAVLTVDLLASDGDPNRKHMTYRFQAEDDLGTAVTLLGRKEVVHGERADLWRDTTTLFVELFRGRHLHRPDGDEDLLGSGVLHLSPVSFARQLTTFRAGPGLTGGVRALGGFGLFFGRQLWQVYGRPRTLVPFHAPSNPVLLPVGTCSSRSAADSSVRPEMASWPSDTQPAEHRR